MLCHPEVPARLLLASFSSLHSATPTSISGGPLLSATFFLSCAGFCSKPQLLCGRGSCSVLGASLLGPRSKPHMSSQRSQDGHLASCYCSGTVFPTPSSHPPASCAPPASSTPPTSPSALLLGGVWVAFLSPRDHPTHAPAGALWGVSNTLLSCHLPRVCAGGPPGTRDRPLRHRSEKSPDCSGLHFHICNMGTGTN